MSVEFFTDGASSKSKNAGYSCVRVVKHDNNDKEFITVYYGNLPKHDINNIVIADGELTIICGELNMNPTNNRAELTGILVAAKLISNCRVKNATIVSDSEYCVNTFSKWLQKWQESHITLYSKKNLDLILEIDSLLEGSNTTFIHQYGHIKPTDLAYNRIAKMNNLADKYACEGKNLEYAQTKIIAL